MDNIVRIFDTTLRDGEQSPGATMTTPEKLEVARILARMGVDVLEAGFPAASPDDLEAVRRIAQEIGSSSADKNCPIICGLAAILGHTFSLFVRFRGGKGVATSAGAFLGLAPMPMLIAGAVFLVIVGITRMVSLGSITAAAVAAVSVFFFPVSGPVRIVAVLVAALIILRHHSNIKRILKREEPRL